MEKNLAKEGYEQGDMKPVTENYQRPDSSFAEDQFGKTLNYIGRQDRTIDHEASQIRKQNYVGRYS